MILLALLVPFRVPSQLHGTVFQRWSRVAPRLSAFLTAESSLPRASGWRLLPHGAEATNHLNRIQKSLREMGHGHMLEE